MGIGTWSRQYHEWTDPEFNPNIDEPATFPPNYGFPGERTERKMIATEDEMVKAKLPLKHRDYCAHYYISYLKCKRDAGRFMSLGACGHEKHEWEHCQYEDFVMRMKEYERERRLLQREKSQEYKKALVAERRKSKSE